MQVKDLCGVCGGSNGQIAPESNELCCETVTLKGDTNNDGTLTVLDVIMIANYILDEGSLTPCQEVRGDINDDGNMIRRQHVVQRAIILYL